MRDEGPKAVYQRAAERRLAAKRAPGPPAKARARDRKSRAKAPADLAKPRQKPGDWLLGWIHPDYSVARCPGCGQELVARMGPKGPGFPCSCALGRGGVPV